MNAQGKAPCAMPNGGGMGARGKQALGGTIRQPTGGRAVFQGWGKRAVFSIGEPVAGTPGGGFDNGRRGVVGKGGEGKGGRSPPARIAIVNTAWGGFAEAATGAAVRPQGGGEGRLGAKSVFQESFHEGALFVEDAAAGVVAEQQALVPQGLEKRRMQGLPQG